MQAKRNYIVKIYMKIKIIMFKLQKTPLKSRLGILKYEKENELKKQWINLTVLQK